jgi:hypothetical protein
MYISDLDYLKTPAKIKSSSYPIDKVKGGISIGTLSFGFAEGSKTALTITTTETTAISFSFKSELED